MAVLKLDVTGKVTVTTQNSKKGIGLKGHAPRTRVAYHMKLNSVTALFLTNCAIIVSY
jgi:hypothetical protein